MESLIPIVHNFKEKISKHIILYDEEPSEERLAYLFCRGIGDINKQKSLKYAIEMFKIDEDSKADIANILTSKLAKEQDLYLNATQSDTTLVVLLSDYVLDRGGSVIAYDKFDNSYNLITKKGFTNNTIEHNLTLDEFVTYRGYKNISEGDIKDIERYRSQINNIFKNTNRLFEGIYLLNKKKIKKLDKPLKNALMDLGIIDKNYHFKKKASFGRLFEYFIYLKLAQYDFDDIKIGVEILFDEELGIRNEFDILAIKSNHISVIECKLGSASNASDVIYKLDSLMENFGEDSKGFIVNLHSDSDLFAGDRFIEKRFSQSARKRARYNNLEIYNDYLFSETIFDEIMQRFFGVRSRKKSFRNEPLFLLGGIDLEMIEIKKMLIAHNKHYIDKRLSWGAKLSSYIGLLDKNIDYYGIELIEDVTPPSKYKAIDHHNDMQQNLSSIEQVAQILGVKLDRYQMLVALNDRGYIPAMQEFGATEVEIELIRQRGREAQGATKEDELLAEISIEEAQRASDILLIKSQTPIFSTISDRCYGREPNILIYTDKKLLYQGRDIKKLVKRYRQEIKSGKAYYGGGFGFFGLSEGRYVEKGLEKLRREIVEILSKSS